MSISEARLKRLRQEVLEVAPDNALAIQAHGGVIVDVREESERSGMSATGAVRLGRGFLELKIEAAVPDLETPIVLMCAGGARSLYAADSLRRLGYRDVSSLAGGFEAWKAAGLPLSLIHI